MQSYLLMGALMAGFIPGAASSGTGTVHMLVRHEVADYARWRQGFDGLHDAHRKMDISAEAVFRSADDPNDVTVDEVWKSAEAARAQAAFPGLKATMQKFGVTGTPQVWVTTLTPGSSGNASHIRMFVQHEVADYAAWRKAYDQFRNTRRKMGVAAQGVYQSTENLNEIIAYHDFASLEKAKAFAASPDLKSAMRLAGVKGEPQIWFTTRALK